MTDPMNIGAGGSSPALDAFLELIHDEGMPRVLELGTLQAERGVSTHHATWLPEGSTHVKSDFKKGPDVDVVADAHNLAEVIKRGSFDAAIAVSVWEHLEYPWVCARQLGEVLRVGGFAYVATHHTFPVHGYPSDYTRWTDDGLAALFRWVGFEVVAQSYAYPCTITPPREVTRWNPAAPAYLNVDVCVRVR